MCALFGYLDSSIPEGVHDIIGERRSVHTTVLCARECSSRV